LFYCSSCQLLKTQTWIPPFFLMNLL
jgi:hypothetical protein